MEKLFFLFHLNLDKVLLRRHAELRATDLSIFSVIGLSTLVCRLLVGSFHGILARLLFARSCLRAQISVWDDGRILIYEDSLCIYLDFPLGIFLLVIFLRFLLFILFLIIFTLLDNLCI